MIFCFVLFCLNSIEILLSKGVEKTNAFQISDSSKQRARQLAHQECGQLFVRLRWRHLELAQGHRRLRRIHKQVEEHGQKVLLRHQQQHKNTPNGAGSSQEYRHTRAERERHSMHFVGSRRLLELA